MPAPLNIAPAILRHASEVLQRGGLVAYPTDTVYGLAAMPEDKRAVWRLFRVKGRSADRSVPLLIASPKDVAPLADGVPEVARALMKVFWPGPLTIVLKAAPGYQSAAIAETVALRVPDHTVPRELVRLLGGPITGTSANASEGSESLQASDVRSQLGDAVDFVIDGGRCPGGGPSTVVDCTTQPPNIVREGAIDRRELIRVSGIEFA